MAQCLKPGKFGPCRKCSACLDRRVRSWLFRLLLESFLYDSDASLFVTFTYAPENLPSDIQGCKKSLQLFFKRLRHYFNDCTIRYACALESGSNNTKRFHWHAIIYGIKFTASNRHFIDKAWGNGFTDIKLATPGRMSYILKYIIKGSSAFLMSRNPGLGDGMIKSLQESINKLSKSELAKLRSREGVLQLMDAEHGTVLTRFRSGKYDYPIHQFLKDRLVVPTMSGKVFNRAQIRSLRSKKDG